MGKTRIRTLALAGMATMAFTARIPAPLFGAPADAAEVRVVVAADGTGDFPTVQRAIDHAPAEGSGRLVIAIRPGVYHERLVIPQDRPRLSLEGMGSDPGAVVITAGMSAKEAGGTFLSSTVDVEGSEFEAANLTFENTFGRGSQAVAITVHSDRAVFRHCRFLGWQDTLYAASGRQYYEDCYIEGVVDFIFGNAAAVFERCEIHSVGAGYVTAQSRTAPDMDTGFVFDHCKLTGENTGKGVFLGRPWRPFSRVVYLHCWMGSHIPPGGWDNWRDAANEKTAWYGELDSSGPGANPGQRVTWARQLTPEEASKFAPRTFLAGADGWEPAKNPGGRN